MQLPESIETYGYFWLVEKPDNRLTGVLRISDRGDAYLEMFGAFDSPHDRPLEQLTGERLHILGVTDKAGPVTLVDCIVVQQTDVVNVELLSKSSVHVGCVFWGAHFDSEDICFSGVTFSVKGLDEWFIFHHRPFSRDGDAAEPFSATYNQPEPITFPISDDLNIGFHMGAGMNSSPFEQAITTKMSISIESSRMRSFSEFMQLLRKVKNFICLAFDRSVSFTTITGSLSEQHAPDNPRDTVVIYSRFDPYDLPKEKISAGNFLISFEEMSQDIHEYLPRWLENYEEYEPTFNLYFTVTANRYVHLEGGFLFLINGIESLHRRSYSDTRMPAEEFNDLRESILRATPGKWRSWIEDGLRYANELSLRSRISQMITPFDDLFGTKSTRATFVNQVVTTRNYLTHYDPGIRDQAVTEPQELLQLCSRLEALVQLHLLRLLGIDKDRIRNMATQYSPLRRKLGFE